MTGPDAQGGDVIAGLRASSPDLYGYRGRSGNCTSHIQARLAGNREAFGDDVGGFAAVLLYGGRPLLAEAPSPSAAQEVSMS